MTTENTSELLQCFHAEAQERLQRLNNGLLILEKGRHDDPVLDGLFREAHTLKGAAGMIGCGVISSLSHGFENVLTAVKNGVVNPKKVAAVLFRCCDMIKDILDKGEYTALPTPAAEALLEELAELVPDLDTQERSCNSGKAPESDFGASSKMAFDEQHDETIRVATGKLDCLANTVGEIVISRVKLAGHLDALRQLSEIVKSETKAFNDIADNLNTAGEESEELALAIGRYKEVNGRLSDAVFTTHNEHLDALNNIEAVIDNLQNDVVALRMRPISTVFDMFPRVVRDLAEEYGKTVEIEMEGRDTELDRSMLEGIKDPLMHLLRNAVDHGIETRDERKKLGKNTCGRIRLTARQDGDRVYIELEDDGRGIDPEQVRSAAVRKGIVSAEASQRLTSEEARGLIFTPGLSTNANVNDISGRGVGTDVVKKYVEDNLQGQVILDSKVNEGTKFTLMLPLTIAVTPSVLVRSGGELFAIPAHSVQIGMRVRKQDLRSIDGKLSVNVIGANVPIVRLDRTLHLPTTAHAGDKNASEIEEMDHIEVVVVEHNNRRLAFVIDEMVEEQDIVVKRLERPLGDLKYVAGVTILEKGEIVPILQVGAIIKAGERSGTASEPSDEPTSKGRGVTKKVLVVEDSLTTRELMKNIMRSAGYYVVTASDGVEALNAVAREKLDLIVTDIQMPRMDGFEMTQRLKNDPKYKDIPVIIVTSLLRDEERKRGLDVGADVYMRKGDFDQSKLVETIERLTI
jgi:two-component system chemotaxis sensor kinase CheA